MLNLFSKLKGKKTQEPEPKEVKCICGEVVTIVSGEEKNVYFCRKCNKLVYYIDPSLLDLKVTPLSLGWLKKRR